MQQATKRNFQSPVSHSTSAHFLNLSDSQYEPVAIWQLLSLSNLKTIMGTEAQKRFSVWTWLAECPSSLNSGGFYHLRMERFFSVAGWGTSIFGLSLFVNWNPRAGGQEWVFAETTKIHEKKTGVIRSILCWATGRQRGARLSAQQGSACSPSCRVPSVSSMWLETSRPGRKVKTLRFLCLGSKPRFILSTK